MRMWEIREGDDSRYSRRGDSYRAHDRHEHEDHEYGERGRTPMRSYKDESFEEGYDCGYEDGYKAAMKEVKHSYGERGGRM